MGLDVGVSEHREVPSCGELRVTLEAVGGVLDDTGGDTGGLENLHRLVALEPGRPVLDQPIEVVGVRQPSDERSRNAAGRHQAGRPSLSRALAIAASVRQEITIQRSAPVRASHRGPARSGRPLRGRWAGGPFGFRSGTRRAWQVGG